MVGPFTAVVTLRVRRPLPMDAFGLDSSSSDDDGSYERVVHARAAKKAAPAPRPPSPRAYVATARRSANQLQRPKRSAAEMLASITAKPRAAAAQARPERPLPPRAAPVRLPSSSRPSAAKRRRAPPTRSDPIVSESESSDDDSPQSRYLRDMLFFDPNKRAVEDARGRKVDAAAAAPSAAASASVLGRSDDDDDDDDERRHTSAAASHPQFGVEDGPDASVECHASKPCVDGLLTGHFAFAKLGCSPNDRFGKKSPRCHLPL